VVPLRISTVRIGLEQGYGAVGGSAR
jgi:hypothetical protein